LIDDNLSDPDYHLWDHQQHHQTLIDQTGMEEFVFVARDGVYRDNAMLSPGDIVLGNTVGDMSGL